MRTGSVITIICIAIFGSSLANTTGTAPARAANGIAGDPPGHGSLGFVTEPEKQVPVVYDVDVVVAGAGVSGIFAAIAAARNGAETVLIERFESVGGISGPGHNPGGGTQAPGPPAMSGGVPLQYVYPEIAGIPKEFAERLTAMKVSQSRLEFSIAYSYLSLEMLREAGVHLLLSTFAADPIMDGNTVKGVFVENKSGRGAVKAKVVIDATGEADMARRAGAPILYPKKEYYQIDKHAPTGVGTYAYVGGVDWERYNAALANGDPKTDMLGIPPQSIGDLAQVFISKGRLEPQFMGYLPGLREVDSRYALAGLKVQLTRPHEKVDAGNAQHMTQLQAGFRKYIWETVQHMREDVPGCEKCYLVEIAPYLGNRGGPCIDGEYTLTEQDVLEGRRFDDVMYLFAPLRTLRTTCLEQGECEWGDAPYRIMIPKRIDGLIAVGRSASGIPDTLVRVRTAVMHMGQVGGIAAAIAAKEGISPRQIDVKHLQKELLSVGFYLGDEARLKELGLLRGDFDGDGDVDQEDFGVFQQCYTGPGGYAAPSCEDADFDSDEDVDLDDFDRFQRCVAGPNRSPGC